MFLNHYLDITDAIADGQNELVDDTDLQGTDFPTDVPLPRVMHVDAERHEQVREWILTNAMDRDANQVKQPTGDGYGQKGFLLKKHARGKISKTHYYTHCYCTHRCIPERFLNNF